MGKTLFTSKQFDLLEHVQADEEITRWFYLTGGTALAEFYLKHRYSEDIDLFSYSQVDDRATDNFLKKISKKLKIKKIDKDHYMGLYVYKLTYEDNEVLKVDFNEYEFLEVERSDTKFGNLIIDSFYDIAINKLYTVTGRFATRDFIDLYFILRKDEFSVEQLIDRANEKFMTTIDISFLTSQFLKVNDLPKAYPKMLVPFHFEEMVEYFTEMARYLGKKVLK